MRRVAGIGIAVTLDELLDILVPETRRDDPGLIESSQLIAFTTFIALHSEEWNRFVVERAVPAMRRMLVEVGPDHLAVHGEHVNEETRARIWANAHHRLLKGLMLTPSRIKESLDYFEEMEHGNPIRCEGRR